MSKRLIRTYPAGGFTLLELLVVLAIAGLMISLVPAAVSAAMPGAMLKTATLDLARALRKARNKAVSRGLEIEVVIHTEQPGYSIAGETPQLLPSDIELSVLDGNPMPAPRFSATQPGESPHALRFYPDGSASRAVIKLDHRRGSYRIDVDWLIGRVTVLRGSDDE